MTAPAGSFADPIPPAVQEANKKLHDELAKAMERVIAEFEVKIEQLTREQFVEALRQAVLSGDFAQHVVSHPVPAGACGAAQAQCVTYMPFREVERLHGRITRLEAALSANGISDPDTVTPE